MFAQEAEPLLRRHPGVWPPGKCGAAAFEWACGMVQSRAFHLVKENWVTMTSSAGGRGAGIGRELEGCSGGREGGREGGRSGGREGGVRQCTLGYVGGRGGQGPYTCSCKA